MKKNKIFAIFILIAVLITCAGVSFASNDFDDSYMDDSDIDNLDFGLDDELDEDLNDDIYEDDDSDDFEDEDLDEDDDWDEDLDDDEDWDDEDDDWDEDFDDDEDWDDDYDDWEYWDGEYDIDWQDWYYDDLDFVDYEYDNETYGNVTLLKPIYYKANHDICKYLAGYAFVDYEYDNETYGNITLLKPIYYKANRDICKYLAGYATSAKTSGYRYNGSDSYNDDNETDLDSEYPEIAYHETFFAACLLASCDEDIGVPISCSPTTYDNFIPGGMDLGDITETFDLNESQINKTDVSKKIEIADVVNMDEGNNILAILAFLILCMISLL